tara:strand:- start:92 stop:724 length:633 start_codon:yes stop_codon:yes gene_type:complete
MSIRVESFLSSEMQNLSYLIIEEQTSQGVIIDPTFNIQDLLKRIEVGGFNLSAIWLTHTHFDHINGLDSIMQFDSNCPIYVYEEVINKLPFKHVIGLQEGNYLECGDSRWSVIHTPGHSPDGICFYCRPHLISGDTLFIDRCGRADLVESNVNDLFYSLNRLKQLPGDTIIYPGHHYGKTQTDTISNQLMQNPYLKTSTEDDFIRLRMGR